MDTNKYYIVIPIVHYPHRPSKLIIRYMDNEIIGFQYCKSAPDIISAISFVKRLGYKKYDTTKIGIVAEYPKVTKEKLSETVKASKCQIFSNVDDIIYGELEDIKTFEGLMDNLLKEEV